MARRYGYENHTIEYRNAAIHARGRLIICSIDPAQAPTFRIEPIDIGFVVGEYDNISRNGDRGSGLGLTLARHIIDSHGGQIVVNSALGKGSRFTILIPRYSEVEVQGEHEHESWWRGSS